MYTSHPIFPRYAHAALHATKASVHSLHHSVRHLPLPFKVRTRREKRHALIHDRLADPEVIIDPLLDAGGLGELVRLHTGTVSTRVSRAFVAGCGGEGRT